MIKHTLISAVMILIFAGLVRGAEHWTCPEPVTELTAYANSSAPFLSFNGKNLYFKSDCPEPNLMSPRFYVATRA